MADIRTMDEVVMTNARPRFCTLVLKLFSTLALTLADGITSYAVTRPTTEFGIRMALGAEPAKLFSSVMGQGVVASGNRRSDRVGRCFPSDKIA